MFLDGEEGWASTMKEKVAPDLGLAVALAIR